MKSTKNEILDAYYQAMDQLKKSQVPNKQDQKRADEQKEVITVATKQSSDEIVKHIADLKIGLVKSLEEVEEKLCASYKRLTLLQQAIEIQTQELAELHEIKVNADTLAALLFAQKERTALFEKDIQEKQVTFEQDMAQKRMAWKKEQDDFELMGKEQEAQMKKTRQREEDEYVYQRDLSRQKESDQYFAEKEALEKELMHKRTSLEQSFAERSANLAAQEQLLGELKIRAEQFPTELAKAIEETTQAVTDNLRLTFDYETKLAQKEIEGERKLYQQTIGALEAKVQHIETQNKQLLDKANQANLQVQDIAVKAIEGASRPGFSSPAQLFEPVRAQ